MKKLTALSVVSFFSLIFIFRCTGLVKNENILSNKQEKGTIIYTEIFDFNGVNYKYDLVLFDSIKLTKVFWINSINHDTITYFQDVLFISDTIYDINRDGFNDLITVYSTCNGNMYYEYLFIDNQKKLDTIPLIIHDQTTNIDGDSFFNITPRFLVIEFEKFKWGKDTLLYQENFFIDISEGIEKKIFFKTINQDTLYFNESNITPLELDAVNNYFETLF